MKHYVPFLKMKQNEIGAFSDLDASIAVGITPFFDLPRPKEQSLVEILDRLRIARKCADKNMAGVLFYLDNFDFDDTILLAGKSQYGEILNSFSQHRVVPVVALHRDVNHNFAAIAFAVANMKRVAVRFTREDVESYRISKPGIRAIFDELDKFGIEEVDVVIDFRVLQDDPEELASMALKFLDQLETDFFASKIIITASSIPASVRDLLKTKEYGNVVRRELELWEAVLNKNSDKGRILIFGDYGLVSPEYTDMELDFAIIQNIAAPKVYYTYAGHYFLVRGGAFKTHPDKYRQYYAMADLLVNQIFFRDVTYSLGEEYILDRSHLAVPLNSKTGSPGSWLRATLTSHMTFVLNNL